MRNVFLWAFSLCLANVPTLSADRESLNQRLWNELALATGKVPTSGQSSSPEKRKEGQSDQVMAHQSGQHKSPPDIPHTPKRRRMRQR